MGARGKLPKSKLPIETASVSPSMPYKRTKEDEMRERRYKAEDGLRALEKAENCKKDKQLMSDIKNLAKEKMTSLKRVAK